MKVFVGCFEIATILSGIAEGFKQSGHDVTTFVFEKNKFYPNAKYDIVKRPWLESKIGYINKKFPTPLKIIFRKIDSVIDGFILKRLTNKFIERFDLFIFIWQPWLPEQELFPRIKKAGKKIICLQVGSDVRHISAFQQEFGVDVSSWEKYFHLEDLNEKIKIIRYHELYADAIFSVPDQAGLSIRAYNHLYIPLQKIEKIKFQVQNREIPIVIHAPSRLGLKGTDIICKVMGRLKKEGIKFEFKVIQNLTNDELLNELSNADILIDQIFLHGPAVLSLEAMLAGTIVATRVMDKYKNVYDPPVIDIRPETIYEVVKDILINHAAYKSHLEKARDYVLQNNSPRKVAERILNSISNKHEPDYQANFFLSKYVLPVGVQLTNEILDLNKAVIEKCGIKDSVLLNRAIKNGLLKRDYEAD